MSVLIQSVKGSTCWEKVQLSEDVIDLHHQKTNTHTIHVWYISMKFFSNLLFLRIGLTQQQDTTSKNWNNAQPPTLLRNMWSEIIPKCRSKGKNTRICTSLFPCFPLNCDSRTPRPYLPCRLQQENRAVSGLVLAVYSIPSISYRIHLPFGLWIRWKHPPIFMGTRYSTKRYICFSQLQKAFKQPCHPILTRKTQINYCPETGWEQQTNWDTFNVYRPKVEHGTWKWWVSKFGSSPLFRDKLILQANHGLQTSGSV